MPATSIVAIATGDVHTVALKDDGTVLAWGYNFSGQCTVPATVTGIEAIAAGGSHTVALGWNVPVITSPLRVRVEQGGTFSYRITASPTSTFGLVDPPPGWGVDPLTGSVTAGSLPADCLFLTVSASNAVGTTTAMVAVLRSAPFRKVTIACRQVQRPIETTLNVQQDGAECYFNTGFIHAVGPVFSAKKGRFTFQIPPTANQ